jgi:hypothetical protein
MHLHYTGTKMKGDRAFTEGHNKESSREMDRKSPRQVREGSHG